MERQTVLFKDLGRLDYKTAWDFQESLLRENVKIKSAAFSRELAVDATATDPLVEEALQDTKHYLFFVEHPPVYTLG